MPAGAPPARHPHVKPEDEEASVARRPPASSINRLRISALLVEDATSDSHPTSNKQLGVDRDVDRGGVERRHKRARRSAAFESESSEPTLVATDTERESAEEGVDDIFDMSEEVTDLVPPKSQQVRELRAEATRLEKQFLALVAKWRAGITDPEVLLAACEAAKQRWITSKYQEEQQRLKDQLLLQQLFLATIQRSTNQSPLIRPYNSIDIYEAIHDPIHLLAVNRAEELERLVTRSDLALRLTPSLVDRLTSSYVNRATPLSPFTTTSISSDQVFTYMFSTIIAKIENADIDRVFSAVLDFFGSLNKELRRHYDIVHNINVLKYFGTMRNYSQIEYDNSLTGFSSVSHTVFAGSLTSDTGIIVIDFVDGDDLYPNVSRDRSSSSEATTRDATIRLSLERMVDPVTSTPCILVRQVRVHRFNLLPNSPKLLAELRLSQASTNGDLFMGVVCRQLQAMASRPVVSPPVLRHT